MRSEIISHWQIQEGLLQSYRSLFLTSQSVIFSIASVIATGADPSRWVFSFLLVLGVVLIWFWFEIGNARGLDVSYFQMLLIREERGEAVAHVLLEFKQWQKLSRKEKFAILNEFGLARSQTRQKLEVYVPALFLLLWLGLSVVVFVL